MAGEMRPAFAPVEAGSQGRATAPARLVGIDAESGKDRLAGGGQGIAALAGDEMAARLKAVQ